MVCIKEQLPKPMTNEELEELYKNWNEESWKVLAERNMRLAIRVANSFSNTDFEEEDLFSVALFGLVKSAKKFDPSLGYKFSTLSTYMIKNEILMELRKRKIHPYPKESIDEVFVNAKGDSFCIAELIPDSDDIEDSVLFKELTSVLKNKHSGRNREKPENYNHVFQSEITTRNCKVLRYLAVVCESNCQTV